MKKSSQFQQLEMKSEKSKQIKITGGKINSRKVRGFVMSESFIITSVFISWFFLAVVIGTVASTKEKSFGLWFFLSVLLSPLVAGFCLVITLMPSKTGGSNISLTKDDFEEKWSTLLKYDEGTKKAVKQLEAYGNNAIDELKKALRATNDPTRLQIIADQIAKDFQAQIEINNKNIAIQAAIEIQNQIEEEKIRVSEQIAKEAEIADRTKAALLIEKTIQDHIDKNESKIFSTITNSIVREQLATAIINGFKVNKEIKFCTGCGSEMLFTDMRCNECSITLSVASNERAVLQRVEKYLKWCYQKNVQMPVEIPKKSDKMTWWKCPRIISHVFNTISFKCREANKIQPYIKYKKAIIATAVIILMGVLIGKYHRNLTNYIKASISSKNTTVIIKKSLAPPDDFLSLSVIMMAPNKSRMVPVGTTVNGFIDKLQDSIKGNITKKAWESVGNGWLLNIDYKETYTGLNNTMSAGFVRGLPDTSEYDNNAALIGIFLNRNKIDDSESFKIVNSMFHMLY